MAGAHHVACDDKLLSNALVKHTRMLRELTIQSQHYCPIASELVRTALIQATCVEYILFDVPIPEITNLRNAWRNPSLVLHSLTPTLVASGTDNRLSMHTVRMPQQKNIGPHLPSGVFSAMFPPNITRMAFQMHSLLIHPKTVSDLPRTLTQLDVHGVTSNMLCFVSSAADGLIAPNDADLPLPQALPFGFLTHTPNEKAAAEFVRNLPPHLTRIATFGH